VGGAEIGPGLLARHWFYWAEPGLAVLPGGFWAVPVAACTNAIGGVLSLCRGFRRVKGQASALSARARPEGALPAQATDLPQDARIAEQQPAGRPRPVGSRPPSMRRAAGRPLDTSADRFPAWSNEDSDRPSRSAEYGYAMRRGVVPSSFLCGMFSARAQCAPQHDSTEPRFPKLAVFARRPRDRYLRRTGGAQGKSASR